MIGILKKERLKCTTTIANFASLSILPILQQFSTAEDCIRSSPEYAIDIQKELLKKENTDLKSKCERLVASLRNKDTQLLHTLEKNKELSKSLETIQVLCSV